MPFFKSAPNLNTGEKARVEFLFQEIVDRLGWSRVTRPVVSLRQLVGLGAEPGAGHWLDETLAFIGNHLEHDLSGLQVHLQPEVLEACGGGG